ncbi:DUF397 domain-containing protein [Streptomyces sp. NPDC102406]|uniref:DUF397 domain-containing protein n=1 Tax=Streptomyces sp. NPDC102406 TaxID=3366171 RepID=UPI00382019F3
MRRPPRSDTHRHPRRLRRTPPQPQAGRRGAGPWIEVAFGGGDLVHLRETSDPDTVVTTTRAKWDAFALGVRAGEFDHFVEGP